MNETRYSFWRYKQDLEWKISTKIGLEVVFQEPCLEARHFSREIQLKNSFHKVHQDNSRGICQRSLVRT